MRNGKRRTDRVLKEYRKEYQKAGLEVTHYADIDAFVLDFLGN